MNFKIVENVPPRYISDLDEFVELYNNPNILVDDIKKRMDLSVKQYLSLRNHALEEGLIKNRVDNAHKNKRGRRSAGKHEIKNYSYDRSNNFYRVVKCIDGKYIFYGTYPNARTAELIVKGMREFDWDKSKLSLVQERVLNSVK